MLRVYEYNGARFLFEDGDVPEGAVLVEKKAEPKNKAKKPENKSRKAATK